MENWIVGIIGIIGLLALALGFLFIVVTLLLPRGLVGLAQDLWKRLHKQ